jgi:hypothetical protein
MNNYEQWFDELDAIWPIKRFGSTKQVERSRLEELVKTEQDFSKLKNKIEIEVADKQPKKLPQLVSLIEETFKVTPAPIVSVQVVLPVIQSVPEPVSEVDKAFDDVFLAWPENDIKQNKIYAKQAFSDACRKHGVDSVKAACDAYIQEQLDCSKASVNTLGIRRFVSIDDILERWISKAKEPPKAPTDTSWFDAAWSWYPEFQGRDKVREDSLSFYSRFVPPDDAIDFWCAIRAYSFSRKEDVRNAVEAGTFVPENEVKFTKSFINFVRCWKEQKYADYLVDVLIGPIVAGFKKRNISYWCVYPEEMHASAVLHNCRQYKGAVWVVNTHVENVCKYLTSGKNYANITVNTPMDYGMVSEVLGAAKEYVKRVKIASSV